MSIEHNDTHTVTYNEELCNTYAFDPITGKADLDNIIDQYVNESYFFCETCGAVVDGYFQRFYESRGLTNATV
jgi:hypothetical protein